MKKHPAKFTPAIMDVINQLIMEYTDRLDTQLIDPFGGIGGVFQLSGILPNVRITSVELEKEWAIQGMLQEGYRRGFDRVIHDDFLAYADRAMMTEYDMAVTSPAYGNRMADKHEAKDTSERNTYRHKLGRPLSDNSSAGMQWGQEYKAFHKKAWTAVYELLRPGGVFVLNVKDHIRKDERQHVAAWHRMACKDIGFMMLTVTKVPVKGNRQGQNGDVRIDYEEVIVLRKPWQVADGVPYAEQRLGGSD